MIYAHNQTFKNREICVLVMEATQPTDDPYWVEVDGDDDPLNCEFKDGQYIKLTDEELQELYAE